MQVGFLARGRGQPSFQDEKGPAVVCSVAHLLQDWTAPINNLAFLLSCLSVHSATKYLPQLSTSLGSHCHCPAMGHCHPSQDDAELLTLSLQPLSSPSLNIIGITPPKDREPLPRMPPVTPHTLGTEPRMPNMVCKTPDDRAQSPLPNPVPCQ